MEKKMQKFRPLILVAALLVPFSTQAQSLPDGEVFLEFTTETDRTTSVTGGGSVRFPVTGAISVQVGGYYLKASDDVDPAIGVEGHLIFSPDGNASIGLFIGHEDYYGSPYDYYGIETLFALGKYSIEPFLAIETDGTPYSYGGLTVSRPFASNMTVEAGAIWYEGYNAAPFIGIARSFRNGTGVKFRLQNIQSDGNMLRVEFSKMFGKGSTFGQRGYSRVFGTW
jgi:hypothetical protein